MRFSRIMDQVEGISQKSLTKTLRGLERDGLITREVFAEVPPRVEYTITALGSEMLDNVAPLWLWVAKERPALSGLPSRVRSSRTPAQEEQLRLRRPARAGTFCSPTRTGDWFIPSFRRFGSTSFLWRE